MATVKSSAEEIVDFERMIVDGGTTLVSSGSRSPTPSSCALQGPRERPLKNWKLTPEDWRNREKRPAYVKAIEFMISSTDVHHAHWNLIGAENKHFARPWCSRHWSSAGCTTSSAASTRSPNPGGQLPRLLIDRAHTTVRSAPGQRSTTFERYSYAAFW